MTQAHATAAATPLKNQIKPIVTGMIGVANFGKYRRERMRDAGVFQLVGVCDQNPQFLAEAAQAENAKPFTSFDEMLAMPGLEAVVISTGANSHAPLALRAMEAGKHVYVEKPLCTSPQEVGALRRMQERTGRVFGVGHTHAHGDAVVRSARQIIADGKLGELATYEVNSTHSGGLEIKPGDWRGDEKANPGGMLFQCGVHSLHSLHEIFGPVESVSAMMRYDVNRVTTTADVACVIIRHASGMIGTLNCYHVTAYCHAFRLFGTHGNLYIDTHHVEAQFQPRKRNAVEPLEPYEIAPGPADGAVLNLLDWARAIRLGGEPDPSLEDGIAAVMPVFAAEISNKEGRHVAISEMELLANAR